MALQTARLRRSLGGGNAQPVDVAPPAESPTSARRGIPAWLLSATLHGLMLVVLVLSVQAGPQGANVEPDRMGGIVLVGEDQGTTEYFSEEQSESGGGGNQAAAEPIATDSASEPPATESSPAPSAMSTALAGLAQLPSDTMLASGGGSSGLGASELLTGVGPSRQVGGKTRTGVFGVSGEGTKFVYVFDRSGSMEGYDQRPIRAAKSELKKSLQSLSATHQFQIVFYNERPVVFNPNHPQSARLLFGDDRTKRLAERFVEGITADGGTRHMEALAIALRMSPDVIFFLTDAAEPQLSASELTQIRRLNRAAAAIHTIEFGTGPAPNHPNFLTKLAEQNQGRYVYIDVSRLPRR